MFFWITASLLAAGVAASLVMTLLPGRAVRTGTDPARAIHRAQLAEVDRDLARGLIDDAEADRARTEVARRILESDRTRPPSAGTAPARVSRLTALMAGLALTAGSIALYLVLGSPGQSDQPRAARLAAGDLLRGSRLSQAAAEERASPGFRALARITPPPDIAEKVANLRADLARNPDDLAGWQVLTDFYQRTGHYPTAAAGMAEVVRIKGNDATADDLVRLVDLMVFATLNYVSPEAEAVLDRLASMSPEHPALLYYTGLLYAQTDRADLAFPLWRRVIEDGGDSLHARLARDGIGDIAWLAGRAYTLPPLPSATPAGPGPGEVAAAADMSPEDRAEMIRGMVAGLSERLDEEGGTAEEWARLITSLGVLGETARAEAARAKAEAAFAGSLADLAVIGAAAAGAGLAE